MFALSKSFKATLRSVHPTPQSNSWVPALNKAWPRSSSSIWCICCVSTWDMMTYIECFLTLVLLHNWIDFFSCSMTNLWPVQHTAHALTIVRSLRHSTWKFCTPLLKYTSRVLKFWEYLSIISPDNNDNIFFDTVRFLQLPKRHRMERIFYGVLCLIFNLYTQLCLCFYSCTYLVKLVITKLIHFILFLQSQWNWKLAHALNRKVLRNIER